MFGDKENYDRMQLHKQYSSSTTLPCNISENANSQLTPGWAQRQQGTLSKSNKSPFNSVCKDVTNTGFQNLPAQNPNKAAVTANHNIMQSIPEKAGQCTIQSSRPSLDSLYSSYAFKKLFGRKDAKKQQSKYMHAHMVHACKGCASMEGLLDVHETSHQSHAKRGSWTHHSRDMHGQLYYCFHACI